MEIEVDILDETDHALLVNYEDNKIWLPKSQIEETTSIKIYPDGRESQIIRIPFWLASEKGLV